MVKLVLCSEKELLNLKDSKLTQKFYGNKTGFVRPGHILRVKPSTKLFVWLIKMFYCLAAGGPETYFQLYLA